MSNGSGEPLDDDLESYLVARGTRSTSVPICCTLDPTLLEPIERKVASGSNSWKAFVEWLDTKDIKIRPDQLARHFNNGVPHARP